MTLILCIIIIIIILPYCLAETWTVDVYTGNERFAGTDSNIYIRLFNSEGESTGEAKLTHYNWMPDNNDFPIRNLFEMGARERFRIRTEYIGSVSKIQIRHNNFPTFQADWLLDQVIIVRNRDGTKYTFKCNCWLRKGNPSVTIAALPDQRSIDKNKTSESFSKNNRAFVVILLVLITLLVCIFCCFNQYRRRQRRRSLSLNDAVDQIHQNPSLLDIYPQSSGPSSPSSGPQLWMNTIRRWKNFRNELPSYSNTRTTQSATISPTTATITPTDEPPAYDDLYPNATTSINPALTSNL